MRFLHTSDWHLGRRLFETDLHPHHEAFLDWLQELAVAQKVDAVVVAGDVYDRAVPPPDSVRLLDGTFVAFAELGVPLIVSSGNHDSAVRLGFARRLSAQAGVHLFTAIDAIERPVVLHDAHGPVAFYGIPYLSPDSAKDDLDCERTHGAVLDAAMSRIRTHAAENDHDRVVVVSHAFVTGGTGSESERDLSVGGIGDAPASVYAGASYVALGHLHGAQAIAGPEGTTLRYSGSPLPFSFSEQHQTKSVHIVDLDASGQVAVQTVPIPQPRGMREVRGQIDALIEQAEAEPEQLRDDWIKAVLTDPVQPQRAMDRLRSVWPNTLTLEFRPEGGLASEAEDLARLREVKDPKEVCGLFVEYVSSQPATEAQRRIISTAVESVLHAENPEGDAA